MDFQASDILGALFGACTPGDIRVHYTALFIDVASMMGAVHPSQDLLTTQTVSIKGGGNSRESYRVGVVHKGALSAPEMLKKELAEGRCGQRMFFLSFDCAGEAAASPESSSESSDGFFVSSSTFGPFYCSVIFLAT
jgi:hypothetical protein